MKRLKHLLPQTVFIHLFSGCSTNVYITEEHELKIIETGFLYGIVLSVLIFYLLVSLLGLKSKYPLYFRRFCFWLFSAPIPLLVFS